MYVIDWDMRVVSFNLNVDLDPEWYVVMKDMQIEVRPIEGVELAGYCGELVPSAAIGPVENLSLVGRYIFLAGHVYIPPEECGRAVDRIYEAVPAKISEWDDDELQYALESADYLSLGSIMNGVVV